MQINIQRCLVQKMDSDSPLFSLLDSNFAVFGIICVFLAAFAAVLSIATVIVMARAY